MVFSPSDSGAARHLPSRTLHPLFTIALISSLATLSVEASAKDKPPAKNSKSEKSAAQKEPEPTASKQADSTTSKESEPAVEDKPVASESETNTDGETSASASATTGEVAATGTANGGPKNTIVFIDGGIRSDQGTLLQRDVVGRFETEEEFDVKSFGPMFHVGFLTKLFWQLRIGAAFGYGFNYVFKERLTTFEEEQDQEPQEWIVGQLHTLDIRLEFSQKLADKVWLTVTPRGGVQAVLIGDDLKEETAQYEDSHDVRQGPQPGFIFGGNVGVRYMLLDWFSGHLAGGYSYSHQGLLKASRKGDVADSEHLWRSTASRVGLNLGVEANF